MLRGNEGQTCADECRETPGGETGSPETDTGIFFPSVAAAAAAFHATRGPS